MAAPSVPTASRGKVPGFAESFWSSDYAAGLGVLFSKLNQGVIENQQVLTIASMRAEAEEIYSERLGDIAPTIDRMPGGFSRDDGASVRKAYEGVRGEMVEATKTHKKIADNIRELVVNPFSRWCDAHAARVQNSQGQLQAKIKAHDQQANVVKKLHDQYYNKCRLVEDAEEETKFAFQTPEKEQTGSPKPQTPPKIVVEEEIADTTVEIGDKIYTQEELKKLLSDMLESIPLNDFKVPIVGTYSNCATGSDITQYIQTKMGASTVGYAERIGQDFCDRQLLRLVGSLGQTFANSSKMNYQWRPRAWQIAGVPEKPGVARAGTSSSLGDTVGSPTGAGSFAETFQNWKPFNNQYPNETTPERLKREARETDEKYKIGVRQLDLLRCELEETMMEHLKFLERCETDRLRAIKSVMLDLSGAIGNCIPSLQSQVDHMMLYQETIQPLGDLRYLLENYRTGPFIPRVTRYENYYRNVEDQTFGVDLEARAKADRKRVPLIVTSILTFLDNHYPDLEGDEARRGIWLVDVPLAATHHLRNSINDGKAIPPELLEKYEIPVVASALKLYLLELPDSLVSKSNYDVIKTIYNTTFGSTSEANGDEPTDSAPRIQVLQSTLGQLPLNNIATLDAITNHFTLLIDLTSADESYVSALAQVLAPCILRPKNETSLTMEDKHAYRLVRDLFQYKEAIFGELKRQSSSRGAAAAAAASAPRQRAASAVDEGSRRAAMEARAKAINQQRQRDKSPVPANRHRRDKSTDGSMGRFPVVPASPRPDHRSSLGGPGSMSYKRGSLEVPGSVDNSPVSARQPSKIVSAPVETPTSMSNGGETPDSVTAAPSMFASGGPGPHIPPPPEDDSPVNETATSALSVSSNEGTDIAKQASLRRTAVGGGGRRVGPRGASLRDRTKNSGSGNTTPAAPASRGVELTDRLMDDDDFS